MRSHRLLLLACAAAALAGCASAPLPTTDPAALKSPRPGFVPGYLERGQWVDSLALLAPPPAPGSPAQAADDAAFKASRTAMGTPRWALAERDAELRFPQAAAGLACTLGLPISAEATPHLTMLLRRTLADAGLATYKAKDHYQRQRPFVGGNEAICTPGQDASLRKDGSYPSGHAAVGWAWGLVLAEIAPERADALVQRGRDFGDSRVICGVHWRSDVEAGRLVAAAVVAQLHAHADFLAQLGAARKEVATLRAAGARAPAGC